MVFCGKPSSGCHACRKRKTRCDALPDGCSQCKKSGRVCPGYRSKLDVMFRDQTKATMNKVNARTVVDQGSADLPTTIVYSLVWPRDDQALSFFMFNYAGGFFHYGINDLLFGNASAHLSQLLSSRVISSAGVLQPSLEAVGLICLANHIHDGYLQAQAQKRYIHAIQLINTALASCPGSTDAATLLAVNLLGMFEVFHGQGVSSMKDLSYHAQGAMALTLQCSNDIFTTVIGQRVLIQTTINALVSCLQWSLKIPDRMLDLLENALPNHDDSAHVLPLVKAMVTFSQFRYTIRRAEHLDARELMTQALHIDSLFESVMKGWKPMTVETQQFDDQLIFEGRYYVHARRQLAASWNAASVFRLLLHQQLCTSLQKVVTESASQGSAHGVSTQLAESVHLCNILSKDVLAGIPQQIGFVRLATRDWSSDRHSSQQNLQDLSLGHHQPVSTICASSTQGLAQDLVSDLNGPYSAGFSCMWPLWAAGSTPGVSLELRAYCANLLHRIGHETGIHHALVLEGLLRNGGSIAPSESVLD